MCHYWNRSCAQRKLPAEAVVVRPRIPSVYDSSALRLSVCLFHLSLTPDGFSNNRSLSCIPCCCHSYCYSYVICVIDVLQVGEKLSVMEISSTGLMKGKKPDGTVGLFPLTCIRFDDWGLSPPAWRCRLLHVLVLAVFREADNMATLSRGKRGSRYWRVSTGWHMAYGTHFLIVPCLHIYSFENRCSLRLHFIFLYYSYEYSVSFLLYSPFIHCASHMFFLIICSVTALIQYNTLIQYFSSHIRVFIFFLHIYYFLLVKRLLLCLIRVIIIKHMYEFITLQYIVIIM